VSACSAAPLAVLNSKTHYNPLDSEHAVLLDVGIAGLID
jgi:hypothetical protein